MRKLAFRPDEGVLSVDVIWGAKSIRATRTLAWNSSTEATARFKSLFSALAYDAAWLVLDAIMKGATSGKEIRDHLLKLQELPTLGGPAEFGPGGVLRRPVFLIQVKHGQFVQLD